MCFSATASFVTGGTLSVVGVLTLNKARKKRELPFASIPALFGIQQLIEGVVWLSFSYPFSNILATYAYAMFAYVWWPTFIPLSILLIEKNLIRKKFFTACLLIGLAVSFYFLYLIIQFPITAQVVNKSIVYNLPQNNLPIPIFYLMAIGASLFFSSYKLVNVLGVFALLGSVLVYKFYTASFISVWCFFAAIISLIIYFYFKFKK